MTDNQFVGKMLLDATAISSIVGSRVYDGLRLPDANGNVFPAINYYFIDGGRKGIKRAIYSINCRAVTSQAAMALKEKVIDLFDANGLGSYGDITGFSAYRVSLVASHQVIPEVDAGVFNAAADIQIIF